LIFGDIFAVIYYKRNVVWSLLAKLLPAMILGVLIGVWIGKDMDEYTFKKAMSIIILVSVVIMFLWEKKSKGYVPQSRFFAWFMGLMAGFTTMIGNLAGAFSNIFFLAMRIDKKAFIGTAAYLFFFINIFKLPFHLFYWKTITKESFTINLYLFPIMALGLWVGVHLINKISTDTFRRLILLLTAIGAIVILAK